MSFKKVIAATIGFKSEHVDNGDGTYHVKSIPFEMVPQKEIDMHPLEVAMWKSKWAITDNVLAKKPDMPTKYEEHEWLIEHGTEYIKQKRVEIAAIRDSFNAAEEQYIKAWRDAEKAWNDHCEWCAKNGHDHDTYTGPK